MKKTLLCVLLFSLMLSVPALATSLWTDQAADIYKDRVASEVGDLVTIIIVEKSNATQRASTETAQTTALGAGPGLGMFSFVEAFNMKYDDKNGADGVVTQTGLLDARITAQIIDKQPNGNLIIKGKKTITINGENQEIEIVGVIRKEDISPGNTIQSIYMTDVEIHYTGQGVVGDKQKSGLFEKLFNWLF